MPIIFKKGLLCALAIIVVDQISKQLILEVFLSSNAPFNINITGFLDLVLVWNKGVSFGMFASDNPYQSWFLAGLTTLIVNGLTAWLWRASHLLLGVALGFIIGGAIGNIIDRIRFGAVVDFVYFHIGNFSWPAFNVADITISFGVIFLILDSLRKKV